MSIHRSAIHILDQIERVISQFDDEQFQQPLTELSGASIGQHVRHALEFFLCTIEAKGSNKLNYDERNHDPYIEREVKLASSVIQSIKEDLGKEDADFKLEMEADYGIDYTEKVIVQSTYFRELAYTIEHSIHHLALIKIGLRNSFPKINFPDHFGVASSTVRHNKLRSNK